MNDDDFNFDFEDLSPEEQKELEREFCEKEEKIKKHPLRVKGNEIYEVVSAFIESLEDDAKEMYGSALMESALLINGKLAGAIGSDNWLICMQNASLIRYHAEYIHTSTSGLTAFTNADKDYVKVLRTTMQEFRELFIEWVKTFDSFGKDDYTDEWGLFLRD
jgi:DNA replication initiation complex subunit (GINS family)